MPPKGKNEPSKKTVEKQKQKVIEDKTFGLKNKKGAKQQKFVQQVSKQVTLGNKSAREVEIAKQEKEAKKEEKKKQAAELNALFKPVAELQKVAHGVDPKSVLCQFFKQGKCTKGDKCKFSHDLSIARKTEKRSIYDGEGADKGAQDSMENWSQQQLEEVVNKKHGESERSLPPTTIICKYFLDAVEDNKYGWFWSCPNGEKCHYRHALPPGFVLKRDKKKMEEQREQISLEELIESERAALASRAGQTPVTLASFLAWKRRKRAERQAKASADKAKRQAEAAAGRVVGISGREMFEFRPEMGLDADDQDDDGGVAWDFRQRESEEDPEGAGGGMQVREIRLEDLYEQDEEASECGAAASASAASEASAAGAVGGGDSNGAAGVVIDENLFADEDLDELDNIDKELDTLELQE
ncbi:hypothetical protein BOX15_Mlig016780g2 [Macrostomum lignano]|uniref:Uncharacterized protein n=2 Tax=Macrostomum lignano TaxID=282301 RepID=A0A267ETD3_9PLAT|nr:hypothetical protein BOX15_Mlig015568g1 [Macrostomum lignano]PAA71954.1 hypothetical protein BOX15_Mlig016780g1 [Macrostomum lignano]PAA81546.1 hypothetical protein BOX15_Mlig016780g2 [Macrostomum lignano]